MLTVAAIRLSTLDVCASIVSVAIASVAVVSQACRVSTLEVCASIVSVAIASVAIVSQACRVSTLEVCATRNSGDTEMPGVIYIHIYIVHAGKCLRAATWQSGK